MTQKATQVSLTLRLIRSYVRPYIRSLVVAGIFMLVAAAMTAAFAKLVQPVLDDVLYGKKQDMLLFIAGMTAGAFILRGFATYIHTVMMSRIGEWIIGDIQKQLFSRFIDLDLSFHQEQTSSSLLSRVMNDVQMVRTAITDTMTGFGKSLMTLLMLAGVMFYQDWKLALAAFAILPLTVLFVAWVGRRLRKISKNIQHELGALTGRLLQILQGIRLVKAYGQEEYERARAKQNIEKVRSLMVKAVRVGNLSTPFNEVIVGIVVFSIILYGGMQVAQDAMTPGVLISFIAAFILAYEPMKKLAKLNSSFQMGLGAAERVFEMIDHPAHIKSALPTQEQREISFAHTKIVFQDVVFHYEQDQTPVLDGVSFAAEPGQVTAIVGASGAGKSTIFNLLLRFYDATSGDILVNDVSLRDIDLKTLRANMALVAQDVTLFNESVADNIAYGSPKATQAQIEQAAAIAAAHDFVCGLGQGYKTILGEDGAKLSGGQRQRIAIARAILRDAPILLLDEATSALDNEAEKAIQDALSHFQVGRTTLVIAHRLSTVKNADKIIVLQEGKIVEEGVYDSLLAQNGPFSQMVKMMGS